MASDNFTASNGTPLATHDANWTGVNASYPVSNCVINSNIAEHSGAWAVFSAYYSASNADESQVVLVGGASIAQRRVSVRMASGVLGYSLFLGTISGGNYTTVDVEKNLGWLARLATGTWATASNHTVRITASGTSTVTLRGYIDATEAGSGTTDASAPLGAGSPGFVFNSGAASAADSRFDDWTDNVAAGGAMSGTSAVVFSQSAALTGSGALAGNATATFSQSATLTGSGALAGSSAVVFGQLAALTGAGALTGNVTVTFGESATLVGAGSLAGVGAVVFGQSAALTGAGALAGTSNIVFSNTGTLENLAAGAISGTAAMVFGESATLLGAGALAGTASLTFSQSAALTGSGALSGVTAMVFGDSATLVDSSAVVPIAPVTGSGGGRGRIMAWAPFSNKRRLEHLEENIALEADIKELEKLEDKIHGLQALLDKLQAASAKLHLTEKALEARNRKIYETGLILQKQIKAKQHLEQIIEDEEIMMYL